MSQLLQRCDNCEKSFPESKMATHFGYCKRNIKRCPRCNDLYDINFQEDHDSEFHSHQPCPHCQLPVLPSDAAKHQAKCLKKPQFCQYCELNIPFETFPAHLKGCESRTKPCDKCKKNVINKDYLNHLISCNGAPEVPLSYQQHISNQQKILEENKFRSMDRPQKRAEIQTRPEIKYQMRQADKYQMRQADKYQMRQADKYEGRQADKYQMRQADKYEGRQADKYEGRQADKYEIKPKDTKEIIRREFQKKEEPRRQIFRKEEIRPQQIPIRPSQQFSYKPHEVPRKPVTEHQPYYPAMRQPDVKVQPSLVGKIVGNSAQGMPEPARVIYQRPRNPDPNIKFMKPKSERPPKEQTKQYYPIPERISEFLPISKKIPEERQHTIKPSVRHYEPQRAQYEKDTTDSEIDDTAFQEALLNSINYPKKTHLPFDSKDMPPEWMNESFIAKQNAIYEDLSHGKRR